MKLGGWLMMLTGMILVLTFLGIDSGLSSILSWMGISTTSADFAISTFFTTIIVALGVIGTGAIVIGLFAKSYDPSLIITPFIVLVLALFIKTFVSIINLVGGYEQSWITSITIVIFGVLGVGFVMSGVDYFANR